MASKRNALLQKGSPGLLSRRQAAAALGGLLMAPVCSGLIGPAFAQRGADADSGGGGLRGTQREGTIAPIPVAIPLFLGEDERFAAEITQVITADLERSGLFQPLDPASFIERVRDINTPPRFQDWRVINAQGLVIGRTGRGSDGRHFVEFRLYDVLSQRPLDGKRFMADANSWRRLAHRTADTVYERMTGERGYFDTQIVFIDETGARDRRRKRLAIMDQDGANVRYLTQGDNMVVTPRYSPATQDIAFMSQASGQQPRVQVINLESGSRQVVGNFPEMTSSPRFAPDGQKIVLSLQQGGNANIFVMDLGSRATTRITNTNAIDTSPSFSPDGREIVFESDRGGQQQIYVMGADGSNPRRISFGEGSYSQPAWSPRGDLIAFTKRSKGGFAIGVMKPDGSGERILTEGFHNEGPTWAPNGQYVMFFRDPGGQGGGRLYMVDVTGRVEQPVPTPTFASDPTWSPLLTEARSQ
jgi:TolB protein